MIEQPKQNKLEHTCFPQPTDSAERVWRYLDLAKFIWLLENQKLYLSGVASLNDSHEGSTPKFLAMYEDQQIFAIRRYQLLREFGNELGGQKFLTETPRIIEQNRQRRANNQKERRQLYVNCWRLGPESEVMWRLYCLGNNGVAIQTSYSTNASIADWLEVTKIGSSALTAAFK